jgi:ribosomal protein L19E
MAKGKKKVFIPTSLYEKVEEEIASSEIKSVEDYVIKLLEEKFLKDSGGDLSKEDEDKVKERLKALGYMD